jgi:hypothetical protein
LQLIVNGYNVGYPGNQKNVNHTFLLESGRWKLEGSWLERNSAPSPVSGKTLVGWTQDSWFTMVTKLSFPNSKRSEITLTYKGRLDFDAHRFTFVLQHSELGKIEGEGWVAPESILQRYWVMDDNQMRTGFQTFYQQDKNRYHYSSGIVAGSYLDSAMEAVMTRHSDRE